MGPNGCWFADLWMRPWNLRNGRLYGHPMTNCALAAAGPVLSQFTVVVRGFHGNIHGWHPFIIPRVYRDETAVAVRTSRIFTCKNVLAPHL